MMVMVMMTVFIIELFIYLRIIVHSYIVLSYTQSCFLSGAQLFHKRLSYSLYIRTHFHILYTSSFSDEVFTIWYSAVSYKVASFIVHSFIVHLYTPCTHQAV